jgi:hypothetical protein
MKINNENEFFFLSLVDQELLIVEEDGRCFNSSTGNEIGKTITNSGYKSIGWKVNGKVKHQLVHRLVHILYNDGFTEEQPLCNHKDGNKQNNHFSNLEKMSSSENQLHAFATGLKTISEENKELHRRLRKGEGGSKSKLTQEQAEVIREEYNSGNYTHRSLAHKYKMHHSSIGDIIRGKSY